MRIPGGRHQAQQRRALGINAEDRLRRRGGNRGGQRRALGNLPVHEGRLSPGTDPSPVGLHVYCQGVFIGEPACQQDRYRRVRGNRHLTRSRIERTERPVAIDTDDRSRRAGIGENEDHVSTRRGRADRDPLGGAGGRAADGTESCEFTAALADKRQARRDDAAGTRDRGRRGRDRSGREGRPRGGRRDIAGVKRIHEGRRTGELHLRGVRALRGAIDARGSGPDEQGSGGQRGGRNPGDTERGQGGGPGRCHLFLHTDRALAATTTRQMPAPTRHGMIHQAL